MNRLFAHIMSGNASLAGLAPDPIIRDYPVARHSIIPSELGPPRSWGKPGSRVRARRFIAGRWVMIDQQRFDLLMRMPRAKARHWLAHNRNKAPRTSAP